MSFIIDKRRKEGLATLQWKYDNRNMNLRPEGAGTISDS